MNYSREFRRSNSSFSSSGENLSGYGWMSATLYELEHGERRGGANARTLGLHAPRFANELPSTSDALRINNYGVEVIDRRPGNAPTEDSLLNFEQQTAQQQRAILNKIKENNNCKNPTCSNVAEVALSCGHISACTPCADVLKKKALGNRKCFVCNEESTLFQRIYRA